MKAATTEIKTIKFEIRIKIIKFEIPFKHLNINSQNQVKNMSLALRGEKGWHASNMKQFGADRWRTLFKHLRKPTKQVGFINPYLSKEERMEIIDELNLEEYDVSEFAATTSENTSKTSSSSKYSYPTTNTYVIKTGQSNEQEETVKTNIDDLDDFREHRLARRQQYLINSDQNLENIKKEYAELPWEILSDDVQELDELQILSRKAAEGNITREEVETACRDELLERIKLFSAKVERMRADLNVRAVQDFQQKKADLDLRQKEFHSFAESVQQVQARVDGLRQEREREFMSGFRYIAKILKVFFFF